MRSFIYIDAAVCSQIVCIITLSRLWTVLGFNVRTSKGERIYPGVAVSSLWHQKNLAYSRMKPIYFKCSVPILLASVYNLCETDAWSVLH